MLSKGWNQTDIDDSINAAKNTATPDSKIPEPVPETNLQYAGFWRRFSAWAWDYFVALLPFTILSWYLFFTDYRWVSYLISIIPLVAFIWMEGSIGGTPGKLLLGLKIQNADGNLIGFPRALLRFLGKMVSVMALFVGYFMIGFSAKKQGLHDLIAGTYVVKTKERKGLCITGIVIGIL